MKPGKLARYQHELNQVWDLENAGHSVIKLTEWHYRIDGVLDIFPSTKKYHHIIKGSTGTYGQLWKLLIDEFKMIPKIAP